MATATTTRTARVHDSAPAPRRQHRPLTETFIDNLKPPHASPVYYTDGYGRGMGSLVVRINPNGSVLLYFRASTPNGKRRTISLGMHRSSDPVDGITLKQARERAREKVLELRAASMEPVLGPPSAPAAATDQTLAAQHPASDQRADEAPSTEVVDRSLRRMLELYVERLESLGRPSAKDVRNLFKLHVYPDPIASLPAIDVKTRHLRDLIARLNERKAIRTQQKLRSFIHAAYEAAMMSPSETGAPEELIGFEIQLNPAHAVRVTRSQFRRNERTLSDAELARYLTAVRCLKSKPVRAALLAHLMLAGQRPRQLLSLCKHDCDLADNTITLHDAKGRRSEPYRHDLPLSADVRTIYEPLLEGATKGPYVHSSDGGRTALHPCTLSHEVNTISKALRAKSLIGEPFTLADLRRTAETHLAKLGIHQELRGRIQSHELGGVQNRHYNRHDFLQEKTEALLLWQQHLMRIVKHLEEPTR